MFFSNIYKQINYNWKKLIFFHFYFFKTQLINHKNNNNYKAIDNKMEKKFIFPLKLIKM